MRAIFIGGTGRCGTTVLRRSFRLHPACATFATELRVLVGPGGLLDLLESLQHRWDPWVGDDAAHRFQQAASLHFAKGEIPTLDRAVSRVVQTVTTRKHPRRRRDSPWTEMYETEPISAERAREVASTFLTVLTDDRQPFVDDTPYNICRARELLELYPDARMIFMVRHPRDVLGSMNAMKWGAPNWDLNARRIRKILRKVLDSPDDNRIIGLKLEDLVAEPVPKMQELCEILHLKWHEPMKYTPIDASQVHRYKLDSAGRKAYEEHLAELAEEMGYKP